MSHIEAWWVQASRVGWLTRRFEFLILVLLTGLWAGSGSGLSAPRWGR